MEIENIFHGTAESERFAQTLWRERQAQQDLFVGIEKLKLLPADEEHGQVDVYLGELGTMTPTSYFEEQLATKLGIPMNYYRRLPASLKSSNANYWLSKEQGNVFLRTYSYPEKRIARAILSDRYLPIDNYDVMTALLEVIYSLQRKMTLHQAFISDRMMSVNLLDEEKTYNIGTAEHPDIVKFGVNVQNSEVGYSAYTLKMYIYRHVCSNGLILGERAIRRVHLGSRFSGDSDDWVSNRTKRLEGEVIISKSRDAMEYIMNEDNRQIMIEKLIEAKKQTFDGSPKVISSLKLSLGFSEQEAQKVWNNLVSPNRFELVNAITLSAQRYDNPKEKDYNPERRLRMEEKAGDLLTSDSAWAKFLSGAKKEEDENGEQ